MAASVACPPYDVVNREEAAELARGNLFSFLHVIRAEIDFPASVDPYDSRVYEKARQNLELLFTEHTFVRDAAPVLFVYELTWEGRSQTGVAGCVHIDDYAGDVIRKHETTRPDKEDDRTRHILALNAQAEPVFLAYAGHPIIARQNTSISEATPLYDFEAEGVRHRVWKVVDVEPYVDAFRRVEHAYVADGHHRCASAWRAGTARREADPKHTGGEEYNWFLAVLFPAAQLRILPYHRVVRDLNGMTADQFVARLGEVGTLDRGAPPEPGKAGAFGLHVGGVWHRLTLDPRSIDAGDPIRSLDATLLQERVLAPMLGIADVRTDPRIDFVGGIRGIAELERRVASGAAAAAFAMHPVTFEQVMAVSDRGGNMPPKSTWFEPKLRSGLFVHSLD